MNTNYNKTLISCFVAYTVQAIIVNFAPMLFLTFNNSYGISMSKISLLITLNFCVQLTVDLLSARLIDKIGYRKSMLIAHAASALGLVGMAFLPEIMSPYAGLIISVVIYAVGGGILEVLISPIVESCPTKNKEAAMSLLHSFYSWGHVFVIIISTLFFSIFGLKNWQILSCSWAIVPILNGIWFTRVPLIEPSPEEKSVSSIKELISSRLFWIMFVMMLCSGASEQGVIQWASAFAEKSLGIPKAIGDLAGPLSFAILMGLSRTLYARLSEKLKMDQAMVICTLLCILSYLLAALSKNPLFSLIGCGLCGFSVGIMWPGTLSLGAAQIKGGGTAMFALFAVAGDIGCSAGPSLVGLVADAFGGNIKLGFLAGAIFPLVLIIALAVKKLYIKNKLRD